MSDINSDPLSFLCAVGNVDSILDDALGPIAAAIGSMYSVYRIKPNSNGDFIQMYNLVDTGFYVAKTKMSPGDLNLRTDAKQGTYWYSLTGDFSTKLVGDVFVSSDPNAPGTTQVTYATNEIDGFALAQKDQATAVIGGRVDRNVTIRRSALITMPAIDDYNTNTTDTKRPLVCTDGVFGFVDDPTATASKVPAGFLSEKKTSGKLFNMPESVPISKLLCYLPPLPGYIPREGDMIIDQNDARYRIIYPYHQDTGTVGSQLELERLLPEA